MPLGSPGRSKIDAGQPVQVTYSSYNIPIALLLDLGSQFEKVMIRIGAVQKGRVQEIGLQKILGRIDGPAQVDTG